MKTETLEIKSGKDSKRVGRIMVVKSAINEESDVVVAQRDFQDKLKVLADFVGSWENFKVYNGLEDGRVVSTQKEVKITQALIDEFEWVYGKNGNRDPGDIYIKVCTGHIFPANVKLIADFNKSGNNMCGVVHTISKVLYGPDGVVGSRTQIAKRLRDKTPFTEEPIQYGFLMINKTSGEVKSCTLFNVEDLMVNPSNGFQFSFDKLSTVERTQREGQEFVASKFIEYITKQAESYLTLVNG